MEYKNLLEQQIHPGTKFGKNVRLGFGVVIEEGCEIGDDTMLANYCVLRPFTKIGKNCKIGHFFVSEGWNSIGDNVRIGPYSIVTFKCIVEDDVFIAPQFLALNDKKAGRSTREELRAPIIKKGARIGGAVTVNPGVVVGEDCLVGSHSLVNKDVGCGDLAYGVPSKEKGKASKYS